MGNIQIEVFPFRVNLRFLRESRAVKKISMHQPRIPQWIKLWMCFFIRRSMTKKEEIIPWITRRLCAI